MSIKTLKIANLQATYPFRMTTVTALMFFISIICSSSVFAGCMNACYGGYTHTDIECTQRCIDSAASNAANSCINSVNERIVALTTRLNRLEGIPAQITTLELANVANQAETAKIKGETTATTQRVDIGLASASEEVKRLEAELNQAKQALENYKEQEAEGKDNQRRFEQRQSRFHRSLKELFIKGAILEDTVMVDCFKRACELSSDFCTSYNEVKKFHENWNKFIEESGRFENLFWKLLESDKELQNIIDQPMQLTITEGRNYDLLALEPNPHKEL